MQQRFPRHHRVVSQKDDGYKQVTINISLDTPGHFIVNVTSDRGGVRSQVCDSQDEVREFVAAFL